MGPGVADGPRWGGGPGKEFEEFRDKFDFALRLGLCPWSRQRPLSPPAGRWETVAGSAVATPSPCSFCLRKSEHFDFRV